MKKGKILILVSMISIASLAIGAFLGAIFPSRGSFYPYLGIFADVLTIIERDYVDALPSADPLIEGAIKGLLAGLDEGCSYLTQEDMDFWNRIHDKRRIRSGFEFLKFYHFLLVISVDEDSPAARAGLQAGDQIIKINGKSPRYLSLMQCQKFIMGEIGSELALTVIKGKSLKRREIKILIEEYEDQGFQLSLKEGDIAHLKITGFQNMDLSQMALLLKNIEKKASCLLLDLRDGSSGDYEKAVSFSSFFVDSGPLLVMMRKGMEEKVLLSSSQPYFWEKPLYILINSRTAGPLEAIASILREELHVPILGEKSFGLAFGQELILLEDGTGIILSTSKYRAYHGSSWNKEGIKPDFETKQAFPLAEGKPDGQLQESIKYIRERKGSIWKKVA